jgi:hypothetical protein
MGRSSRTEANYALKGTAYDGLCPLSFAFGGDAPLMLYYYDHPFEYEPSVNNPFDGRLILDDAKRELLQRLDDENDGWYLDDDGERWPAEELFSRSPWRWESPAGTVKLL